MEHVVMSTLCAVSDSLRVLCGVPCMRVISTRGCYGHTEGFISASAL